MKKQLFTLAVLFVSSLMIAQTQTENYVKTTAYQVPTQDDSVNDNQKTKLLPL